MKRKYVILMFALCVFLSGCVQLVYKVDPEKEDKAVTQKNDSQKNDSQKNAQVKDPSEDEKKTDESIKNEQMKNSMQSEAYENDEMNRLLDFQSQEDIKDFLIGNWIFVNPATKQDAAWLEIDEDMSYELKVLTPNSGYDHTKGRIELKDYQNEENGYGNILSFGIDETLQGNHKGRVHNGEYALSARSIVDGNIMIELTQARGEDSVFFEYFYESSFSMRNVLLRSIHVEEVPYKNKEIYAICWKIDEDKNQVWLDEVTLEQRVIPDGERIATAYTLKNKELLNHLRKSQVESLHSEFPSTALVKAQIDKDSKIIDIEKINWRSALVMPHVALSSLQSLREVEELLNQGEEIHYLEQVATIEGKLCAIYGVGKMLGTPSVHNFEMKKLYAVDPIGNIYIQDPNNTSNWILVD